MARTTYTAIVGDLARSRQAAQRSRLAERLQRGLKSLSERFADQLHAPVGFSRGIDELSGVLLHPRAAYKVCSGINDLVHPYCFRFAIVQGTLDVGVESRDASLIDGPAFHKASDLIEELKETEMIFAFELMLKERAVGALLNGLTNMLARFRAARTPRQQRIVSLYDALGSQEAAGEKLGISQQAVSDALRAAYWKEVRQAEDIVDGVLADEALYAREGAS
jgi:hypothetical protein